MIFKDIQDKKTAEAILREGVKTKFWQLIVEALNESKESLQRLQDEDDISNLPPDQYKLQSELFRAKKRYLATLLKTPENIISWLETPNNESKEFDPYSKSSEL